ncbi:MAG: nitrite reductase (NAD(P)H) small subunit [Ignavibacteriota bacterium]
MIENGYIKICELSDLKERQGKRFLINDVEIAVFKVENEIYAVDNICPHQHSANIYDGFLEDGCVVCPAHGWIFNLKTGKQPTGAKGLDTYPTKIIDGEVFALVKQKELKW